MKIILCMVQTDNPLEATCPPMGILSIASVMEKLNLNVHVFLPVQFGDFSSNLEYYLIDCDIIGFSSTSYNWYVTRDLISQVHRINPTIKIILGGVHPTFCHIHCLRSTTAHIVVRYEGEITFPEVVEAIRQKKPLDGIAGITFKTDDNRIIVNPDRAILSESQLNDMPLPAYHLIPPNRYGYIPIESSRGCFHSCTFCGILYRRSFRMVSKDRFERLIQKLKSLPDRFVSKGLFFTDDSFGSNKQHSTNVLNVLKETDFIVGLEGRYDDLLRYDLLPSMEGIPFYLIQVGVESGYQEGVDKVKKGVNLEKIIKFSDECRRTNFHRAILYSMAIGFPWETKAHIMKTIDFGYSLAAYSGSQLPQINNFDLLPGSYLFDRLEYPAIFGLSESYYDNANWFRSFLPFADIDDPSRDYIRHYLRLKQQLFQVGL